MRFFDFKCPNCNAALSVKDGIDSFYCTYCGAHLVLEGQSDSVIEAKVRVKEMEHEERTQDKKYANEAARWNRKHIEKKFEFKKELIYTAIPIVLLIFLFAFLIFGPVKKHEKLVAEIKQTELEIEDAILNGDYDGALLKANRLRCDDHYSDEETKSWDEKRESYISIIEDKIKEAAVQDVGSIFVPKNSKDFQKLTMEEAKQALEDAGFTDIEMQKVSGSAGWFKKANLVEHIIIGGKSDFTIEDIFPNDTRIVIYYYEK